MMENAYPYLMKNNTTETDLGIVSISNAKSIYSNNLLKGEDKMNSSITNCVETINPIQISIDSSNKTPAPFHHGVPVGFYNAKVVSASRKTQPDTKYDIVRVDMEIEDASHKGHTLSKFYNQSSKDAVKFFRREMDGIGFNVANRHDLDSLCGSLVGTKLVAQIANHSSGNQVILLKGQTVKKAPAVNPDSFWE